ncbi:MAG: DUF481 domain-containing protein [Gemmatimonadales bacterium]
MRSALRRNALLAFSLAAIISRPAPAQALQELVLANGDRLSGTLKRVADGIWVYTYAGTDLRIPVPRIAAFGAPEPIGVRLADGTILAARVAIRADSTVLRPADGAAHVVRPTDIAAVGRADDLGALEPVPLGLFTPLHRFWSATGNLGFSDKRGNSRARGVTVGVELVRQTPRDRLTLAAGVTREETALGDSAFQTTVSKAFALFQADVFVSPRFFLSAATRQERDRFQDLELRSTYTAGFGWQAIQTGTADVRFNLQGGARREAFFTNSASRTAILTAGSALRRRLGPVELAWRLDWAPNAGDFADYRVVSNASATVGLVKGLGVRVDALNEYNSRPRPGVENHDMLVTTTLTYAIRRR